MTTTEINRKLHQALGKYWFKHCPQENPDYCADPRLVIEAMGEKGHWIKFLMSLLEYSEYEPEIYIGTVDGVISLIMDKTGKLAMLALEWLKEDVMTTENKKSVGKLSLGQYLHSIRTDRDMTLRAVEGATNKEISNAYLSQLEQDKIKKPSPNILYTLASIYAIDYEKLMEMAGYIMPTKARSEKQRHGRIPTFAEHNLTPDEEVELLDYLKFLRTRRKMTDDTEKELAGFRSPMTNLNATLDASDPEIGPQIKEVCEWREDDLDCGCWHPSCGGDLFVLNSGPPSENKMKFCCYCGKELTEVAYEDLEANHER